MHGADIVDGILAIALKVIIPEDQRPRKINIGTNEESKNVPNSQLLNENI